MSTAPIIDFISATPDPATPGQQVRITIGAHDPDNRVRRFRGTVIADDGQVFDFADLTVREGTPLRYELVEVDPATDVRLPTQPTITADPALPGSFLLTA